MPSLGGIAGWLIPAIVIAAMMVHRVRINRERDQLRAAVLEVGNAAARSDTTRDLTIASGRVSRLVGDSLRVLERRVVQERQRRDSLDAALGVQRAAFYAMRATLDSITSAAAAVTSEASGARAASFSLREEPYTVDADVVIPPAPDSARIAIRVRTDPAGVALHVGCKAIVAGYSAAQVDVVTPRWMKIDIGDVTQDERVCRPAVPPALGRRRFGLVPLVVGIGRVMDRTGSRWGGFVGIGILWR